MRIWLMFHQRIFHGSFLWERGWGVFNLRDVDGEAESKNDSQTHEYNANHGCLFLEGIRTITSSDWIRWRPSRCGVCVRGLSRHVMTAAFVCPRNLLSCHLLSLPVPRVTGPFIRDNVIARSLVSGCIDSIKWPNFKKITDIIHHLY